LAPLAPTPDVVILYPKQLKALVMYPTGEVKVELRRTPTGWECLRTTGVHESSVVVSELDEHRLLANTMLSLCSPQPEPVR